MFWSLKVRHEFPASAIPTDGTNWKEFYRFHVKYLAVDSYINCRMKRFGKIVIYKFDTISNILPRVIQKYHLTLPVKWYFYDQDGMMLDVRFSFTLTTVIGDFWEEVKSLDVEEKVTPYLSAEFHESYYTNTIFR